MFCGNCGSKIEEGKKFCVNCGEKILGDRSSINRVEQSQDAFGGQYSSDRTGYQNNMMANFQQDMMGKIVARAMSIIGGILIIISEFLPYLKVNVIMYTESVCLFDIGEGTDAFVLLIMTVIAFVFTFAKEKHLVIIGAVLVGFTILVRFTIGSDLEKNAGEYADIIEYGAGAYLSIIGAILVFIAGLIASATKSEN